MVSQHEIENSQEDLTSYHFTISNPVRYGDPDGRNPIMLIPMVIEAIEVAIISYRAYATVNTAINLLSEGVGKDGAKPKGKEVTPAVKDETAVPLPTPEKVIDEKSKPQVSPEVADKLEKMESITVSEKHGGGKNGEHANQKARESAEDRYEAARKEYEALKSKPNKTKEDKASLDRLKKL